MGEVGLPVPGRECGGCTVCCVLLEIQEPSIAKPAGVACRHLMEGTGCAIHATRPDVCRTWMCGWRLIPGLSDEWRPDRSGILIYQIPCHEPGFVTTAFILCLMRGTEHLKDMGLLGFVQHCVTTGVPLYLSLHLGGPQREHRFLNRLLAPLVQKNDGDGFIAALHQIVADLSGAGSAFRPRL